MELKLWKRARPKDHLTRHDDDESLIILRFMIPDVLTAYINATPDSANSGQLLTECVTAFGPREMVRLHPLEPCPT